MKRIILIFAILCGFALGTAAEAQTKTSAKAPTEKKLLSKPHHLSLQWISWEKFGKITFKKVGDTIKCEGLQTSPDNETDYLKISGTVEVIDTKTLEFTGVILTKVYHLNNGEECRREGVYRFVATGSRKYWRMEDKKNPCDSVVDYIDIYF